MKGEASSHLNSGAVEMMKAGRARLFIVNIRRSTVHRASPVLSAPSRTLKQGG